MVHYHHCEVIHRLRLLYHTIQMHMVQLKHYCAMFRFVLHLIEMNLCNRRDRLVNDTDNIVEAMLGKISKTLIEIKSLANVKN